MFFFLTYHHWRTSFLLSIMFLKFMSFKIPLLSKGLGTVFAFEWFVRNMNYFMNFKMFLTDKRFATGWAGIPPLTLYHVKFFHCDFLEMLTIMTVKFCNVQMLLLMIV